MVGMAVVLGKNRDNFILMSMHIFGAGMTEHLVIILGPFIAMRKINIYAVMKFIRSS